MTHKEAKESLAHIAQTQKSIKSKGVKEYMPWFGWALFVLITYPPFDHLRTRLWLPIVVGLFAIGELLTFWYYSRKNKQVHPIIYTSRSAALLSGLLISATIFFASAFQAKFSYTWTLGGTVLAALLFSYGLYLKSKN